MNFIKNNIPVVILLVGMALILIITMLFGNETPTQAPVSAKEASYELCKLAIMQTAHDPTSVEFSSIDSLDVVMEDDNRLILHIPVRAKNGFNALRLFRMECVTDKKASQWSLTDLKQLSE